MSANKQDVRVSKIETFNENATPESIFTTTDRMVVIMSDQTITVKHKKTGYVCSLKVIRGSVFKAFICLMKCNIERLHSVAFNHSFVVGAA